MPALKELPISKLTATLPRQDLKEMLGLVRLLFRISTTENYRRQVWPELPSVSHYDPGHAALMMGYDFHLTDEGPKLIEVNTNAGGGYIAWLSEAQAADHDPIKLTPGIEKRLFSSFLREWQDYSAGASRLQTLVLLDDEPTEQPLYPEMVACRDWLREKGLQVEIVDPEELTASAEGVFLGSQRIDLIYNRHCDFYLEDQRMAGVRAAYLHKAVCLSPNPFAYGLLADKRRMVFWSDPEKLELLDLTSAERQLLLDLVPKSFVLADCDPEKLWSERKFQVFKPVDRFGSRGVLMGKSITRKRFAELDPATTLVQRAYPPSVETDDDGQEFKVDLRLFSYRDHLLGIGARLYQGQVTNLRTEGGGFAPVRLAKS